MAPWLLAVLAFAVTVAETFVASKQTQAVSDRHRLRACSWAVLFEAVLLLDILMVVANWRVVVLPILVGAWIGMWISFDLKR